MRIAIFYMEGANMNIDPIKFVRNFKMANPIGGTIVFRGKRPNPKNSNSMEFRCLIDGTILSYLKSKDFVVNVVSGMVNVRPLLNSFDIKAKEAALKAEKDRAKAAALEGATGETSMDVVNSTVGDTQPQVGSHIVEDDPVVSSDPLVDHHSENTTDVLDMPLESEAPSSPKSYTSSEVDRILTAMSERGSEISVTTKMNNVGLNPIPEQPEPESEFTQNWGQDVQ